MILRRSRWYQEGFLILSYSKFSNNFEKIKKNIAKLISISTEHVNKWRESSWIKTVKIHESSTPRQNAVLNLQEKFRQICFNLALTKDNIYSFFLVWQISSANSNARNKV